MNDHPMSDTAPPSNPLQKETNQWALIMHLSLLAGFILPLAGLIAPIVIYLLKKEALPGLVAHGHVIFNWIISLMVYAIVAGLLSIILIGVPILIALAVVSVIFPIVGAIKASDGVIWRYPLSIQVFKSVE